MECFSVFWARRPPREPVHVWYTNSNDSERIIKVENLYEVESPYRTSMSNLTKMNQNYTTADYPTINYSRTKPTDLREIVRYKAEKHREYYRSLVPDGESIAVDSEMALGASCQDRNVQNELCYEECISDEMMDDDEALGVQRKSCVYDTPTETKFASVKELRDKYIENLCILHDKAAARLAPPNYGYYSSSAGSDDEKNCFYNRVERSASSDSAVGLTQSDEDLTNTNAWKREENANPASVYSPYSPRGSIDHYNVPTKTIIEAQCVPLPYDRKSSDVSDVEYDPSRRHSTFTDDGDEQPRYRYWRTPSVVVSDYSDDVMGLTLEDIEYFRNQRKERSSSPDSSLHSSCSNLNYIGSSISTLDAEYIRCQPFRKSSDCSTCSTVSGDEGDLDTPCHYKAKPSGWRKIRNIVQWTPFFQTYKKQRYPWVQLAGHQGNFKAGPDQGTILKKLCSKEERCFKILMRDVLRPYVPEFKGLVESEGDSSYLQLQDLLGDFVSPCVMDCKIGVRTYLEEELAKAKEKPKLRKDMYEKMCQIDKDAPTEEEHRLKGVTKPRYMVWRETISSTATLGFRIEGLRRADGTSSKDFKTTKTKEQIIKTFKEFTDGFPHAIPKYIQRLKAIKATLESSQFFATHEVIGSSLLFVHDRFNANVWLIDFAKTVLLPDNIKIDHNSKWVVGNHEDGYLIGVNNLISIFVTMLEQQPVCVTPPPLLSQDSGEVGEEITIQ